MKEWTKKEKEGPAYVKLKEGKLILKSGTTQVEDVKILLQSDKVTVLYLSDKDGRGFASIRDGDSFQVVSLKIDDDNAAYATIDPSAAILPNQNSSS